MSRSIHCGLIRAFSVNRPFINVRSCLKRLESLGCRGGGCWLCRVGFVTGEGIFGAIFPAASVETLEDATSSP